MIASATNATNLGEPELDLELDPRMGRTPRGERMRRRAARGKGNASVRVAVARELGIPLPGTIFVLGLTDRRLVFWKASAWLARPGPLAGALPLDEIASVTVVRKLRMVRAAVLLTAGPMLVVQPLWERHLDDLESEFRDLRS